MSQPYTYDPSSLRQVFERHFTFLAGFLRNAHRYAGRLALLDPETGRRWTYAELAADSGRLAAGLAERGVSRGDVVVFQLFNSPEFALLYLAAQRLGAIAAPVNFRFAPGEIAHVLDDSLPCAYIYDETLAPLAAEALGLSKHLPALLAAAP
ncbi:MAG: acyl--CoA ligase, partial [Actinobacteria bacterium]|nr:acyl--CoA ligase [Actinomycetota bacterium]